MRLEAIQIEGYRSIQALHLKDLGPFVVFYGQNGAGKSNILQALALMGRVLEQGLCGRFLTWREAEERLGLTRADFSLYATSPQVLVGATFMEGGKPVLTVRGPNLNYRFPVVNILISLSVDVLPGAGEGVAIQLKRYGLSLNPNPNGPFLNDPAPELLLSKTWPGAALLTSGDPQSFPWVEFSAALDRFLVEAAITGLPRVVPAMRALSREEGTEPSLFRQTPSELLRNGQLKAALFAALISPDPATRRGLLRLRQLLGGPPLHRPHFDPVYDASTGRYDLQEQVTLAEPPEASPPALSVDLAGLGVQQIYFVLAEILIGRGLSVAVEEPEAHLHAPTTGRALRQLLRRVVDEGYIHQLFVATHSNLFDLDPEGYYDVRLDPEKGTVVERSPLSRIDRDHLWEPGPARHALQDMLSYLDLETVVFRRADGSPVSAGEMLRLLQEDHDDSRDFLRDVHGAAVRMVGARARKDPEKSPR